MTRTAMLVGVLGGLWLAACGGTPTGPSISNVVLRNIALQPTAENPNLCCCHVSGTAENGASVPVHLTIKFSALDGVRDEPIATIVAFVSDLEPRSTRTIDAAGFIVPCAAIKDVKTEVDVSGIAFPPL
jgi:hypothetical protein